MPPPTLNDDILLMLPCYTGTSKTLLALMYTCRQLYAAGRPWLLRLRCRVTPVNLDAFHTFLLAEPSRFTALRDLSIPVQVGYDQTSTVTDMLRRTVNLEALHVDASALPLIVPIASASLHKLEQLKIDYVFGLAAEELLNHLQCPLKRLHVQYFPLGSKSLRTLAKFQPTLERIAGYVGRIPDDDDDAQGALRFPRVVSVRETFFPNLRMHTLAAFPNVQILVLRDPQRGFDAPWFAYAVPDTLASRYGALRAANTAFHARHQPWDALVHLDTDARCLYALALQCRTTSLVLRRLDVFHGRDLAWLHMSLAAMRPTYMRIGAVVGPPARFRMALPHGTDGVRKLRVHLVVASRQGRHQDGLNTFFNALPAGLCVLDCAISAAWARGERRGKGDTRLVHHPATQFLRDLDVVALARRALQTAPGLTAMRVELPSGKTGVRRRRYHWVATKEDGVTVGSLREASADEYKAASAIDREVVAFLKENHYGYL